MLTEAFAAVVMNYMRAIIISLFFFFFFSLFILPGNVLKWTLPKLESSCLSSKTFTFNYFHSELRHSLISLLLVWFFVVIGASQKAAVYKKNL